MICTCIGIGLSDLYMYWNRPEYIIYSTICIGSTICSVGFAHCNLAICTYWNTFDEPLVAVFQHFFFA